MKAILTLLLGIIIVSVALLVIFPYIVFTWLLGGAFLKGIVYLALLAFFVWAIMEAIDFDGKRG